MLKWSTLSPPTTVMKTTCFTASIFSLKCELYWFWVCLYEWLAVYYVFLWTRFIHFMNCIICIAQASTMMTISHVKYFSRCSVHPNHICLYTVRLCTVSRCSVLCPNNHLHLIIQLFTQKRSSTCLRTSFLFSTDSLNLSSVKFWRWYISCNSQNLDCWRHHRFSKEGQLSL